MRGWLVAGIAVATVVGAVALAGGFSTVPDASGAPVPPGRVVATGSFDVRIDRADVVENRLRIHAELTNRTGESVGFLPYNLVTVALPDGAVLTTGMHRGVGGWDSGLDPDLPALATLDFDLPGPLPPGEVRVLVRGLEPSGGFLSGPDATSPSRVLAVVHLGVTR